MKLSPNKSGITLGATFAVLYVGCALLSFVWPELLVGIAASWAHSMNVASLAPGPSVTFGSLLYGLVTFTIFGYVTGALFALAWNVDRPALKS